jgi:hypothetical protein
MTYALGRHVDYRDQPAIRRIVRDAAPAYRWSDIIRGVVASKPFAGDTTTTKITKGTKDTKDTKGTK